MVEILEKRKKKQQFLTIVFVGVLFVTVVVAYVSFFQREAELPIPEFPTLGDGGREVKEPSQSIVRPRDTDTLLKKLQEFKSHTPIPIPIGTLGNVNPFSP